MNLKGKGAYVVYVTAFETIFDVAKIVIIFQRTTMKKTITCATTSLLLIGILTLQTLAINFKSEENIDNLVFPFILMQMILCG